MLSISNNFCLQNFILLLSGSLDNCIRDCRQFIPWSTPRGQWRLWGPGIKGAGSRHHHQVGWSDLNGFEIGDIFFTLENIVLGEISSLLIFSVWEIQKCAVFSYHWRPKSYAMIWLQSLYVKTSSYVTRERDKTLFITPDYRRHWYTSTQEPFPYQQLSSATGCAMVRMRSRRERRCSAVLHSSQSLRTSLAGPFFRAERSSLLCSLREIRAAGAMAFIRYLRGDVALERVG